MTKKPTYEELELRVKELEKEALTRKQAEEALIGTNQLLETILNYTHMMVAYLDPKFNFIRVNHAYAVADERETSFFPGKNHFGLYPNKENEEIFRSVVETGEPYFAYGKPFEYAEHPERGVTYWDWSLIPIKEHGSAVTRLVLTLVNVTERKLAEKARQESEERYRAIFEQAADSVVLIDAETGALVDFNERAHENLGYTRKEFEKLKIPDFEIIESAEEVIKHIKRIINEGADVFETKHRTKTGEIRDIQVSSRAISIGGRDFVQSIWRDITERKRMEEALRRREAILGAMSSAAERFLRATSLEQGSIQEVLAQLGKATNVNRVYVFENHIGEDGTHLTSQCYEWVGPGIMSQVDNPDLYNFPWRVGGMGRWEKTLMQGQIIQGHVREFPASEQKILAPQDIQSIVAVPIFVEGKWWGFIGFDECQKEREWSPAEIDALRTAGAILGALIERNQVEEVLREGEEKYRSLVESTEDSIYLLDRNCKYLFMNKKHLTRLSLAPKKAIGRTYAEFHSEDDTKDFIGKAEKVFKTGKSLQYEYISQRDGRYFLRTLSPVKEPDGSTKAMTVISKDITELKRTEKALQTEKDNLRNIFESMEDGIYIVNQGYDIQYVNQVLVKNFGPYEGVKCYEYFHDRDEVCSWCKNQDVWAGKTVRWEWYSFKNERTYELIDTPLTLPDGSIGKLEIFRDITDMKRAEEELRSSQEQLRDLAAYLQSTREQERTSIAREIHDELAQALTALKMDISWLGKKLPKDQKILLEKTRAMTKLTDMTIKTVKRISTELRPGLLDDLGLVAAIEWQAGEFQDRTGITCELNVDPEDIILDRDRSTTIFRIFQETLTNIARHAKAKMVTASLKEKDGTLELKVIDNGKGITEKQISDPKSFGLIGM